MKKIIILFVFCWFLTGCNYRELNKLAIATAISVDKVEDEYEVVVQVVNPTKNQDTASNQVPNFIIYESKAKTLQDALRRVILESPRKLYATQLQVLLISENLAEKDVESIFDFFFRDPEVRKEFYVLVEKGSSNSALKVLTNLSDMSSANIMESLDIDNKFLGNSVLVTFNELMNMYLDDKVEIVLPSVYIDGNVNLGKDEENLKASEAETSLRIGTMAVFKDNKLLGYLTEEESIAFTFIMNEINTTLITYECESNKYLVSELLSSKTDIKADVKNKKITINIKGNASINESTCSYDLEDMDVIKEINKKVNKRVENMIKSSIKSINTKFNSDIYGFEQLFYKTDFKEYEKIKDKWDESIFPNLKINVKSEIKLIEKGNILGGLYGKK